MACHGFDFIPYKEQLASFCQKWKVVEIFAFGSALREDFGDSSDIDLLVNFAAGASWTLFDHIAMEDELSRILGRPVDLLTRSAVENSSNWIVKKSIFESCEPINVAR